MSNSHPLSDGLLGWPGFGPGGSRMWSYLELKNNEVWYAPVTGWYFITGSGGGGGGGGVYLQVGAGNGAPGGGGAAVIRLPIFLVEGMGGYFKIGNGGAAGSNGTPGTNGQNGTPTVLLGGMITLDYGRRGTAGGVSTNGVAGVRGEVIVDKQMFPIIDRIYDGNFPIDNIATDGGTAYYDGGVSAGGDSGPLQSTVTAYPYGPKRFLLSSLRVAQGGVGDNSYSPNGNKYGGGGAAGTSLNIPGNGADGFASIAWVNA